MTSTRRVLQTNNSQLRFLYCSGQMSWFSVTTLDLAQTRQPLSFNTFSRDLLPPTLCYYFTAILVLTPRTFPIRLALLPITLWTAFRASTRIDLAAGHALYGNLIYFNQGLILMMMTLVFRVCIWTFQRQLYTRAKPSKSKYIDAGDLCVNLRGIGWSWSKGLKLPVETRNIHSTPSFLFSTFIYLICNIFLFDLFVFSVQSFGPETIGSSAGGTIFDTSLHLLPRFARALFISLLTGATIYYAIQTMYLLLTFPGILILRQSPSDWPPLFAKPWISTSLNQFWSYRWHQLFRDNFISFGGKPVRYITRSRTAGVLGSFFISGLLHYLGQLGMGRGSDFTGIAGYFIMMGVGTLLERMWKKMTGRRVQGVIGWVWTYAWTGLWGVFLVDAWCIRGLGGSRFFPDGGRPAVFVLEKLKLLNTKI